MTESSWDMLGTPTEEQAQRNAKRRGRQRPTPKLRLAVYQRAGFKCQGCGWAPPVPVPYNPRYCLSDVMPNGKTYTLDIDHVIPHNRGGRLTIDNAQALCTGCNNRKGGI